jgi:CBS-domain-containing membrane protein
MVKRNEWPQLRSGTPIRNAIRILRILSEEKKIHHGHSTPLVLDDHYNLLGMIRLTDLLRSVRHLCDDPDKACSLDQATSPVSDLVIPFAGHLSPADSILEALDIMTNKGVSLVPVMEDGKLVGLIKLSDIFDKVAAILFDEPDSEERSWITQYLHW